MLTIAIAPVGFGTQARGDHLKSQLYRVYINTKQLLIGKWRSMRFERKYN